jgi:hypothetical protein
VRSHLPKKEGAGNLDCTQTVTLSDEQLSNTEQPLRYYLINFSLSRRYRSRDVSDGSLCGGDKSAPEHRHGGRCNPFRTDIYYLGNLTRDNFMND